jgi:hypothetical protein
MTLRHVALLASVGCFAPSYSDHTRCGAGDKCPPGRACSGGQCLLMAPPADAPLTADGPVDASLPVDGPTTDAPGPVPDAPAADAGAFIVSGTVPADGTGALPPTTVVRATFSRTVNRATVSTATFTVATSGGTGVTGTVRAAADGLSATFTPQVPFSYRTTYVARLSADIFADDGAQLTTTTWSFAIDYGWEAARVVWTDIYGPADSPSVAVNSAGDAVVAWEASNGAAPAAYAMIAPAGGDWGQLLDGVHSPLADVGSTIADDGEVDVVWNESVNAGKVPYVAHNVVASSIPWLIQELEPDDTTSFALQPRIVTDGHSVATMVWVQSRPYLAIPFASRSLASPAGWTVPQSIASLGAAASGPLDAATDSAGDVVVVFSVGLELPGIFATSYAPDEDWSFVASNIDGPFGPGFSSGPPRVAMAGGNATAVWARGPASTPKATANRRVAGSWGAATLIDAVDTGASATPTVAVDASGNAVAVWLHVVGGGPKQIWANRFGAGGWGTATQVSKNTSLDAIAPAVVVDGQGNAVAIWGQASGTSGRDLYAARALAGQPWSAPVQVSSSMSAPIAWAMPAIDGTGRVLVVWNMPSTSQIWAAWLR